MRMDGHVVVDTWKEHKR